MGPFRTSAAPPVEEPSPLEPVWVTAAELRQLRASAGEHAARVLEDFANVHEAILGMRGSEGAGPGAPYLKEHWRGFLCALRNRAEIERGVR